MNTSQLDLALEIWARRKWLALGAFLLVFVPLASVVKFLPNVYSASVTLLVENQQVPQDFVRSTVTTAVERRVQTIRQAILSRARLEELIAQFDLYPNLKGRVSPQDIVEHMRHDISMELEQRGGPTTIAFFVSYRGANPETVARVANTLASFYVEEDLRTRERQAGGTADFLKTQLDEMKRKLDAQEAKVSEFKEQHMGELPEQRDANLGMLERLNQQILLNSEKQIRAREQLSFFQSQMAIVQGTAPVGEMGGSAVRIAKLKAELAELKQRYSDKYPDVIRAQSELERLQAEPSESGGFDRATAGHELQSAQITQSIRAAQAEIRVLAVDEQNTRREIARYQERVENAPRREQEFQELSRDYRTTQDVYASLLKRYEESKVAESMERREKGEQFRVLDPAIAPDSPDAPRRGRLFQVAAILALGFAGAIVAAAEMFDSSFHNAEEVRKFAGLPVLARIPRIVTDADRRQTGRRVIAVAAGTLVMIAGMVAGSFVIAHGNERLVAVVSGSGPHR